MRKPITPRRHGVVDYSTVLLTAAAPSLFGFSRPAARVCYALAGGYLGLSMLTDYPLAVKRLIPFPVHGAIEGALGAALPALPKLLGFSNDHAARRFLMGLAALTGTVASLTDWTGTRRELPRSRQPEASKREVMRAVHRAGKPELNETLAPV